MKSTPDFMYYEDGCINISPEIFHKIFPSIRDQPMSAKMKCPNCEKVLKELGDESKIAQGEYVVYDSLANPKNKAKESRIIECLACGISERIGRWNDYAEGLLNLDGVQNDRCYDS